MEHNGNDGPNGISNHSNRGVSSFGDDEREGEEAEEYHDEQEPPPPRPPVELLCDRKPPAIINNSNNNNNDDEKDSTIADGIMPTELVSEPSSLHNNILRGSGGWQSKEPGVEGTNGKRGFHPPSKYSYNSDNSKNGLNQSGGDLDSKILSLRQKGKHSFKQQASQQQQQQLSSPSSSFSQTVKRRPPPPEQHQRKSQQQSKLAEIGSPAAIKERFAQRNQFSSSSSSSTAAAAAVDGVSDSEGRRRERRNVARMEALEDSVAAKIHNDSARTLSPPFETEGQRRPPPIDGVRMAPMSSAPRPNNVVLPGAYAHSGRAFGALPAWERSGSMSLGLDSVVTDNTEVAAMARTANRMIRRGSNTSNTTGGNINNRHRRRRLRNNWSSFVSAFSGQQQQQQQQQQRRRSSIPTAQSIHDAQPIVYAISVESEDKRRKRNMVLYTCVCLLLVVTMVSVGFAALWRRNNSSNATDATLQDNSTWCVFLDATTTNATAIEQQSVVVQCLCGGNITSIDPAVVPYLEGMRTLLASQGALDANYSEPVSSCSYRNVALRWLAQDAEAQGLMESQQRPYMLVQSYVLTLFYLELDGPNWRDNTGWLNLTEGPLWHCNWRGIACSQVSGRVNRLALENNGLNGTIPSELGSMTNLRNIRLTPNRNIQGTLPSELGKLDVLSECFVCVGTLGWFRLEQ